MVVLDEADSVCWGGICGCVCDGAGFIVDVKVWI